MEIQRTVEQKKLKLEMGVDVAALPQETQEEIARAIRKGVEPTQAVAEYMATKASLPAPDTAYNRFYRALEQALKVMGLGRSTWTCGGEIPTCPCGSRVAV